jgi:hypothetical protein
MVRLSKIEREILDATADDVENLEQIYRTVTLQFVECPSGSGGPLLTPGYFRERADSFPLSSVANAIPRLVGKGLLRPVMDEDGHPWEDDADITMVWRAWFGMTDEGKRAWTEQCL